MRKYMYLLGVVCIMFFLPSCANIVANHNIVSEQRSVNNFTEVHLSNQCNVIIEKDPAFSVEVTAPDNIMVYIKTEVSGGVLRITTPDHININMSGETATIHIKMPDPLNKVVISGSGNMDILSSFSNLSDINISGDGNLNATTSFSPSTLNSHISGSGNINLTGSATNHTMGISGSGNINAQNFVVSNATVSISGSGNVLTTVTSTLNATISGSGNIEYWGNPVVNSSISGSGMLIHH